MFGVAELCSGMVKLIPLNSVVEIVAAWGGTKALADWCNIGMSNVSDWMRDAYIPRGWHYLMDREARRRGFLIDPELFGDRPEPDEQVLLERAS